MGTGCRMDVADDGNCGYDHGCAQQNDVVNDVEMVSENTICCGVSLYCLSNNYYSVCDWLSVAEHDGWKWIIPRY